MMKLILVSLLFLTGCANELSPSLPDYMKKKRLPAIGVEKFPHCEGYGCPTHKMVILTPQEWKTIESAFGKPARTPEEEREKIAHTIGVFETIVGPITGTDVDVAGTFGKTGKGQLDCVDESTNTTIYMTMLQQKGLLHLHDIGQPQVRWPIISGRGWMHQTAVITDTVTHETFAVDSWFEDNGKNAWIVPIDAWRNGWHPDQLKDGN